MLTEKEKEERELLQRVQKSETRPMMQEEWDRLKELNEKAFKASKSYDEAP